LIAEHLMTAILSLDPGKLVVLAVLVVLVVLVVLAELVLVVVPVRLTSTPEVVLAVCYQWPLSPHLIPLLFSSSVEISPLTSH
jgi:hypothetical protein